MALAAAALAGCSSDRWFRPGDPLVFDVRVEPGGIATLSAVVANVGRTTIYYDPRCYGAFDFSLQGAQGAVSLVDPCAPGLGIPCEMSPAPLGPGERRSESFRIPTELMNCGTITPVPAGHYVATVRFQVRGRGGDTTPVTELSRRVEIDWDPPSKQGSLAHRVPSL